MNDDGKRKSIKKENMMTGEGEEGKSADDDARCKDANAILYCVGG